MKLKNEYNVAFTRFSDITLKLLKRKSDEVIQNFAGNDNFANNTLKEILKFRKSAMFWSNYSEKDYLEARNI